MNMVQQGNPMLRILSTGLDFYMFMHVSYSYATLYLFVGLC